MADLPAPPCKPHGHCERQCLDHTDNSNAFNWQRDPPCAITPHLRHRSGSSSRCGSLVPCPARPLGFPTVDPSKPYLDLCQETIHHLWLRERKHLKLLGSCPGHSAHRRYPPHGTYSASSSHRPVPSQMSPSQKGRPRTLPDFTLPPVLFIWCPSLVGSVWGLRAESFTHCHVPSI